MNGVGGHSSWRLALLFGALSLVSGILLVGVSVWFLGAVALAGMTATAYTFNFHTPAALVRLFAMTRTAAKFSERLIGHRSAIADQACRRMQLFREMAAEPATLAMNWQFGKEDRLADYVDDVEEVDYSKLRVRFPAILLSGGYVVLLLATVYETPFASIPIIGVSLCLLIAAREIQHCFANWEREQRDVTRAGAKRVGRVLESIVSLHAEGAREHEAAAAFRLLGDAEYLRQRQIQHAASLEAGLGLLGPVACVSVLLVAWFDGRHGEGLLFPAMLGFGWITLGEAGQGAERIVLASVRACFAAASLRRFASAEISSYRLHAPLREISVRTIAFHSPVLRSPNGRTIGGRTDLSFVAGKPAVVTGASGCGKTTLLKRIAGWLRDEAGDIVLFNGLEADAPARRQATYLGLHDAAILTDTLRENLFAPDRSDAELWEALMAVELDERIRWAGGLDTWVSQQTFSSGEAQRLSHARAWLSRASIILLDEPTEHLDLVQGDRILGRLMQHFADRPFLYTSHGSSAGTVIERAPLPQHQAYPTDMRS
jgi:ATP-binding cassette subfamily C protein CydC